jgi:hypothetical protein
MKHFKKDNAYPNEAFIQEAIENYFLAQGYAIEESRYTDLVAVKPNDRWVIEAKGMTSQTTVDFNTCLGQLIKSMTSPEAKYAIAVPNEIKYKNQSMKIPDYFRTINNLYILVIDKNAQIQIIHPSDRIEDHWVTI